MSINYIPFESKSGFRSPGFSVDELGNVQVRTLEVGGPGEESILRADQIYVKNIQLIEADFDESSLVALGSQIIGSSLTRLGTLEFLNIDGDLRIAQGSSPYFSVVNGHVEIESFAAVGRMDNIEIGLQNPAAGNFTTLNVNQGGELNVQGNVIVSLNLTVAGEISTSDIAVTNTPTADNHATRKDYVDSRIAAFSIAFGA
jgi:hypothetical protein